MKDFKLTDKERSIWTDAELDAWMLPREISTAQWAEEFRVLSPRTTAEHGAWKNSRVPYAVGPMEAKSDPAVRMIVLLFPAQSSKTEILLNMLGYSIDQDPGPSLFVQPTEDIAKRFSKTRVQPMLEDTPCLAKHLPSSRADFSMLNYYLLNCNVIFGWSNSPATLASFPIRDVYGDEIDKWPIYSGKEANPVKLMIERTATFPYTKKIVLASTPTIREANIWQYWLLTNQQKYNVPCPKCNGFQILVLAQLKYPRGVGRERIKEDRLAYYECAKCGEKLDDLALDKMNQDGIWVPEGASIDSGGELINLPDEPPVNVGFWINCFYSPWRPLGHIAAERISCGRSPDKLQNFVNSWLCEPWEEKVGSISPHRLRQNELEYKQGEVPEGVKVILGSVDVHQTELIYTIRGWGMDEQSWLIDIGVATSWPDLERKVFKAQYKKLGTDNETMQTRLVAIDSGYRTDEVYQFCFLMGERARAIKGSDNLGGLPYKHKQVTVNPKTGKPFKFGGVTLTHLDVYMLKDKLKRLQVAKKPDRHLWHLFKDVPDEYLNQVTNEDKFFDRNKKTLKERWIWRPKGIGLEVHYWDGEVYNLGIAQVLGLQHLHSEGDTIKSLGMEFDRQVGKKRKRPKKQRPAGGWMQGFGDNWI